MNATTHHQHKLDFLHPCMCTLMYWADACFGEDDSQKQAFEVIVSNMFLRVYEKVEKHESRLNRRWKRPRRINQMKERLRSVNSKFRSCLSSRFYHCLQ